MFSKIMLIGRAGSGKSKVLKDLKRAFRVVGGKTPELYTMSVDAQVAKAFKKEEFREVAKGLLGIDGEVTKATVFSKLVELGVSHPSVVRYYDYVQTTVITPALFAAANIKDKHVVVEYPLAAETIYYGDNDLLKSLCAEFELYQVTVNPRTQLQRLLSRPGMTPEKLKFITSAHNDNIKSLMKPVVINSTCGANYILHAMYAKLANSLADIDSPRMSHTHNAVYHTIKHCEAVALHYNPLNTFAPPAYTMSSVYVLAGYFHDANYDPALSAKQNIDNAVTSFRHWHSGEHHVSNTVKKLRLAISPERADMIERIIRATEYRDISAPVDMTTEEGITFGYLRDADCFYFSDAELLADATKKIKREYLSSGVSEDDFNAGRTAFLTSLFDSGKIFHMPENEWLNPTALETIMENINNDN